MKINKNFVIAIALLAVAALPAFMLQSVIKEFEKYPIRAEMCFDDYSMYENVLDNREKMSKNYIMSFVKEDRTEYMGNDISLTYVDESYSRFYPCTLISGNSMDSLGEALVSESFARENFNTDAMEEAAGETINISGRNYTIVGVYKIQDRYGTSVKESAVKHVYLFSEPMEEIQGASFKVLFSPCDDAPNVFFEEELREYFIENVGYMDNIYIDDYTDYSLIISQFQRGMVFISEFLLLIFFSFVLVRRFRLYGSELKNRLKFQYMNEILSENTNIILIELIKLIILLFIWIFLLQCIIDFQFKIPGRLLPVENIFDFEFYRELIQSFREHPVTNPYECIYRSALKISEVCLAAYILLATAGLVFALKIKSRKTAESL